MKIKKIDPRNILVDASIFQFSQGEGSCEVYFGSKKSRESGGIYLGLLAFGAQFDGDSSSIATSFELKAPLGKSLVKKGQDCYWRASN